MRNGFRGPLGLSGDTGNPLVSGRLPAHVDAVLPMPDIATMLALIEKVGS